MEQKVNEFIRICIHNIRIMVIVSSIAFSTTLSTAYGTECVRNVQPIKEGQVANCSGFLFSDEAERTASKARDDAEYYRALSDLYLKKSDLQSEQSKILEERLKLYMDQSDRLIKERNSVQSTEKWLLLGAFALGVVATGFVVKNVRQ